MGKAFTWAAGAFAAIILMAQTITLAAEVRTLLESASAAAAAADRIEAAADTLAKPTMPAVIGAAMWGIDFSELDTKNDQDEALSTTPLEALDTDLASAEQDESYSQNLYVCNDDADDNLCVGATTWADTCGAGDITCMSGATTDGNLVKPGQCRPLRYQGTERPCIVGTAAISSYQVERITYKGPRY